MTAESHRELAAPVDSRAGRADHESVPWWSLGLLGTALLGAAGWFAWSLPATASRRGRSSAALADRLGPWRWLIEHGAPPSGSNWLAASLVVTTAVFFLAWIGIVIICWRQGSTKVVRAVLALVAAAAAIGVVALPNQTSDVYDYALFGRVVSVHGGAAYHDLPDQYPTDPTYQYASHQYTGKPDNKLPVWTATAVAVTAVAGDDPVVVLLAFRALLAAATVATAALVASTLRRVRPGTAAAGVAVFGLCPVTVVYGASKTDALMALFLVAGLALVARGRDRWGTFAMALSVLVKLITVPVLALVVALPGSAAAPSEARGWGRARSVLTRAAVALGVAIAAYATVEDPFGVARRQISGSSAGSVLPAGHGAAVVVFLLLLFLVAAMGWRSDPSSDVERATALFRRSAVFLVVFAALLTRPGLPWYLMSALAAVALCRSRAMLAVLAPLSALSFLLGWWDTIGTRAHPLPSLGVDRPLVYLGLALVAAAAVLVGAIRARSGAGPVAWVDGLRFSGARSTSTPPRDRRGAGRSPQRSCLPQPATRTARPDADR
ncbi:hypothetical protein BH10ACT1_BH10ACT1_36160 [soil metagenome]